MALEQIFECPRTLKRLHSGPLGNLLEGFCNWLGHADINTTHIYVEIDMEMKRKMLQKAGPPQVKKPLSWQRPDVLQWLNALAKTPQLCAVNN